MIHRHGEILIRSSEATAFDEMNGIWDWGLVAWTTSLGVCYCIYCTLCGVFRGGPDKTSGRDRCINRLGGSKLGFRVGLGGMISEVGCFKTGAI